MYFFVHKALLNVVRIETRVISRVNLDASALRNVDRRELCIQSFLNSINRSIGGFLARSGLYQGQCTPQVGVQVASFATRFIACHLRRFDRCYEEEAHNRLSAT